MAGWWRWIYSHMGWKYVSKNDIWDDRQQHLKFVLCKQIRESKLKKVLRNQSQLDKALRRNNHDDDDNDIIPYAEKV